MISKRETLEKAIGFYQQLLTLTSDIDFEGDIESLKILLQGDDEKLIGETSNKISLKDLKERIAAVVMQKRQAGIDLLELLNEFVTQDYMNQNSIELDEITDAITQGDESKFVELVEMIKKLETDLKGFQDQKKENQVNETRRARLRAQAKKLYEELADLSPLNSQARKDFCKESEELSGSLHDEKAGQQLAITEKELTDKIAALTLQVKELKEINKTAAPVLSQSGNDSTIIHSTEIKDSDSAADKARKEELRKVREILKHRYETAEILFSNIAKEQEKIPNSPHAAWKAHSLESRKRIAGINTLSKEDVMIELGYVESAILTAQDNSPLLKKNKEKLKSLYHSILNHLATLHKLASTDDLKKSYEAVYQKTLHNQNLLPIYFLEIDSINGLDKTIAENEKYRDGLLRQLQAAQQVSGNSFLAHTNKQDNSNTNSKTSTVKTSAFSKPNN